MNYKYIILVLTIFAVLGCLGTSAYKVVSPSDLMSNPGAFEGKKICINLIFENNTVSGIPFEKTVNFTGEYRNWTLSSVCGTYKAGKLEADSANLILSIFTEKDVYHSNETLKVQLDFNSSDDGKGQIQVSGINNAFGRASISETRDASIRKGSNRFDFEFKTPSCEECSAIAPGVYSINATVNFGGKAFETYKKITLEREGSNVSAASGNIQINNTPISNRLANNNTQTVNKLTVEYFYDPSCSKCAQATPVVENVVNSYGERVVFSKYNVLTTEGLELAKKYSLPGVPSIVINKEKLIAYEDYNGDTAKLEALLKAALEGTSVSQGNVLVEKTITLSVPSVLVVGFLAGFNPCLLAILAFIASVTLATTGRRRNVLLIVIMFSLGIFVTYLIVGIGILRIFEQTPALQTTIRNILVVLIGILGLWHVYDAYHLRKNTESSFYTPKAFIRLTESVTRKVSLPASFLMGAIFSLIKAPCVGAVYFVILDMVRKGEGTGFVYLAAYNLGVVLPVLVLGAAIAFGLNPEKVEKFRKEKRALLRLITGATLLIIAVLMYAGII
ncbi:MAG: cytochrome c biogenesis protein CcdA [Candidatus Methanoperedens sp.]|nr:sulfite exporter TauE/SafE family protein [Candidatus Methanoperedens sp.]MCZ7396663.1 sulfite exporter TauE/SafE family protein [Candidatus Methanoperedens sp.]